MLLTDYIEDICDELNIDIPAISNDTSHFPTATTMAQCCPQDNEIIIPPNAEITPDLLFAIAHELRHLYQFKIGVLTPDNYKESNVLSVEEYNQQSVEVDANAYALTVMEDFFGVTFTMKHLSAETRKMIKKRATEIRLSF